MLAALGLFQFGCQPADEQGTADEQPVAAGEEVRVAKTELSLNDYMTHLVQHAAFEIWKWQAYVSDENGSRSTEPKNDEEWEEAESSALTLVQLTFPLQESGLALEMDGWDTGVERLRDAAREAADAAERQDVAAWFETGDRLNTACIECHYSFAPHLESAPE